MKVEFVEKENHQGNKSQQGIMCCLTEECKNIVAGMKVKGTIICAKSNKQQRVSSSTAGSELIALRSGISLARYIAGIWYELGVISSPTVNVLSDNLDVVHLSSSRKRPVEKNLTDTK